VGRNFKVYIFAAAPFVILLAFVFIVYSKMAAAETDTKKDDEAMSWWYAR
tara:strand:+ start:174 stop:323 length:150 start_codon:yes stop_codon:yes gene_type:complete